MKSSKQVLLSKIEATYGVDPVPTNLLNAMVVSNLKFTPAVISMEDRNYLMPWFGGQGKVLNSLYGTLEFDVEIAGSGAAGTVPFWGVHHKASAMSETINVGVSVVYAPVSTGEQSATHYYYQDGIKWSLLGARAKKSLKFNAMGIPMQHYSYTGLRIPATDTAIVVPTLATVKPIPVNLANTTFSLHAFAGVLQEFTVDYGEEIKYINRPNSEYVNFGGRKMISGSVTMEKTTVAIKDWEAVMKAGTTGALALVHGTVAGNKYKLDSAITQITSYDESDSDGVVMVKLGLEFIPGAAGNDDLITTVL